MNTVKGHCLQKQLQRLSYLRQHMFMKTSLGTRVSQMGVGSFVDINIFVMKYCFISFRHILLLHFIWNL